MTIKGTENMCQGDPIGAGVLVTIMGPPEINENHKYFIICHFYTNGAKETMCKHTL